MHTQIKLGVIKAYISCDHCDSECDIIQILQVCVLRGASNVEKEKKHNKMPCYIILERETIISNGNFYDVYHDNLDPLMI